jgi:hypothetical protein
VLLNSDLTSSEHFYTRREMVAVFGEHYPGHQPNNLCTTGSGNWIFDRQLNVHSEWGNCHKAKSHCGNLNQSNYAFGKANGLFHQSASEQQQRLPRKRWLGVESGRLEELMNVPSVLDQFVTIRNRKQSFGRVQHHRHKSESIAANRIFKDQKVGV